MHMSNGLGSAIRVVATAAAAAVAVRAAERRRVMGGAQRPALASASSHSRLQPARFPIAATVLTASADLAPARLPRPRLTGTVATLPPDTIVATLQKPAVGRHRRRSAAVSGVVTDIHGEALAGVTVVLVALHGQAVASTVTGTRGGFVVDDLQPGRYRLKALDGGTGDDGTWYRGTLFRRAGTIRVAAHTTRRAAKLVMPSS